MATAYVPWEVPNAQKESRYRQFISGWNTYLRSDPSGHITRSDPSKLPSFGKIFDLLTGSSVKRVVLGMMHPNPEMRSTIHEVLSDSWLQSIRTCYEVEKELSGNDISSDRTLSVGSGDSVETEGKTAQHCHTPPPKANSRLRWFFKSL